MNTEFGQAPQPFEYRRDVLRSDELAAQLADQLQEIHKLEEKIAQLKREQSSLESELSGLFSKYESFQKKHEAATRMAQAGLDVLIRDGGKVYDAERAQKAMNDIRAQLDNNGEQQYAIMASVDRMEKSIALMRRIADTTRHDIEAALRGQGEQAKADTVQAKREEVARYEQVVKSRNEEIRRAEQLSAVRTWKNPEEREAFLAKVRDEARRDEEQLNKLRSELAALETANASQPISFKDIPPSNGLPDFPSEPASVVTESAPAPTPAPTEPAIAVGQTEQSAAPTVESAPTPESPVPPMAVELWQGELKSAPAEEAVPYLEAMPKNDGNIIEGTLVEEESGTTINEVMKILNESGEHFLADLRDYEQNNGNIMVVDRSGLRMSNLIHIVEQLMDTTPWNGQQFVSAEVHALFQEYYGVIDHRVYDKDLREKLQHILDTLAVAVMGAVNRRMSIRAEQPAEPEMGSEVGRVMNDILDVLDMADTPVEMVLERLQKLSEEYRKDRVHIFDLSNPTAAYVVELLKTIIRERQEKNLGDEYHADDFERTLRERIDNQPLSPDADSRVDALRWALASFFNDHPVEERAGSEQRESKGLQALITFFSYASRDEMSAMRSELQRVQQLHGNEQAFAHADLTVNQLVDKIQSSILDRLTPEMSSTEATNLLVPLIDFLRTSAHQGERADALIDAIEGMLANRGTATEARGESPAPATSRPEQANNRMIQGMFDALFHFRDDRDASFLMLDLLMQHYGDQKVFSDTLTIRRLTEALRHLLVTLSGETNIREVGDQIGRFVDFLKSMQVDTQSGDPALLIQSIHNLYSEEGDHTRVVQAANDYQSPWGNSFPEPISRPKITNVLQTVSAGARRIFRRPRPKQFAHNVRQRVRN